MPLPLVPCPSSGRAWYNLVKRRAQEPQKQVFGDDAAEGHRPNAPARQLDTLHGQASRSRRPNGETHERPLRFAFSEFLLIESPQFTGKSVDTRRSAEFASRFYGA